MNWRYFKTGLLFIISISLPLILWNGLQGVDNLYMYAHAKDMLENGFVREYDIFSLHQGFEFSYQKWAACLLTYGIVNTWGWHGLHIATYVLGAILFGSVFLFGYKYSREHILMNTILILICGFIMESNGTLRFRPHVMAGVIFVWMFMVLNGYAQGIVKADLKFYLFFVLASIGLMWVHSTMWIIYTVMFLPYLCDWKCISRSASKYIHPVVERQYDLQPLWIALILMFVAGICNPNGIYQYQYMFACMRATGDKYGHVDELQGIPFPAYLPVLVIGLTILAVLLWACYKTKAQIYLPSVYLIMGSLAMPLISWRLVFYSALFIAIAGMMQLSLIADKYVALEPYVLPLTLGLLIIIVGFVGFMNYYRHDTKTEIAYDYGTKDPQVNEAVDWLCDTFGEDLKIITTTAHTGSYGIYKGLKPYMDCRAEVYDNNINHKKDVLSEIQNLSANTFNGISLDAGGLEAFDLTYKPDYYILTSYSDADMNLKAALDKLGGECIYAKYGAKSDQTTVWIYQIN